ncbi:unnamed protein product [Taenia asiatica]|uniref:Uncharacterized protein n=1 Tax=Taenia asiatica TaxID=60517 RepID=A0A0R3WGF1_TAEAS|nr:unnamed protein product [Taenia asiatica]
MSRVRATLWPVGLYHHTLLFLLALAVAAPIPLPSACMRAVGGSGGMFYQPSVPSGCRDKLRGLAEEQRKVTRSTSVRLACIVRLTPSTTSPPPPPAPPPPPSAAAADVVCGWLRSRVAYNILQLSARVDNKLPAIATTVVRHRQCPLHLHFFLRFFTSSSSSSSPLLV